MTVLSVAPARERGLKLKIGVVLALEPVSLPQGSVD